MAKKKSKQKLASIVESAKKVLEEKSGVVISFVNSGNNLELIDFIKSQFPGYEIDHRHLENYHHVHICINAKYR